MLTARSEELDRVLGLENGAYLVCRPHIVFALLALAVRS
jgi:DNA-binding response OmpR family regulator